MLAVRTMHGLNTSNLLESLCLYQTENIEPSNFIQIYGKMTCYLVKS